MAVLAAAADSSASSLLFEEKTGCAERLDSCLLRLGAAGRDGFHYRLRR
jgi:hypothetical protein